MRVFLTGASGYIGGVIAEKLLAANHSVAEASRAWPKVLVDVLRTNNQSSAEKTRQELGCELVVDEVHRASSIA